MILELAAVTRTFAGRRVLGPVDLELGPGERLALTGPNGSGKSTLLRCIGGTLAPSRGRITIDGARAGTRAARRRVGASFSQERSFYLRLTGRENLLTFACLREPAAHARRQVEELVAELGLEDIAATRVDRCSTGMVQQLAFARALLGTAGTAVAGRADAFAGRGRARASVGGAHASAVVGTNHRNPSRPGHRVL